MRFSVLFIAAWEFIPWLAICRRFADRQQKLRAPILGELFYNTAVSMLFYSQLVETAVGATQFALITARSVINYGSLLHCFCVTVRFC